MSRLNAILFSLLFFISFVKATDSMKVKYQYDDHSIWDDIKCSPGWIWQAEKSLFKKKYAKYWGRAALLIGGAYILDDDFDRYFTKHEPNQGMANNFTYYGSVVYNYAWITFYVSGRVFDNKKLIRSGRDLIITQVSANIVGVILWFAIGRQRPMHSENKHTFKPFDFSNLDATIPPFKVQPSFPSLHTVGTTSLATIVTRHYGFKYGFPLYVFAGVVGYARMALGGHYFSDIMGGACLGTITGIVVTDLLDKPLSKLEKNGVSFFPVLDSYTGGIGLRIAF